MTTDYVLDETATLLHARGHRHLPTALFQSVLESRACRLEWMTVERFSAVVEFFVKRSDQAWSFTDCFSFILMDECCLTQTLKTCFLAAA